MLCTALDAFGSSSSTPPLGLSNQEAVAAPLAESLARTLALLGPLRLFDEWRVPQRSSAEREVDLMSFSPLPEASAPPELCHSQENCGPAKPLQVFATLTLPCF